MTSDAWTWVVAVWQIGTAAGIAVFWLTWFRQPHTEPWLPASYVDYERVFVFPDSGLTVLLVASAVLLVTEEPLGRSLALVAAGMLTFLGLIDCAYYAQHGMFSRERGGLGNLGIVVATLSLAAVLIGRYA
jgi:hypothetical protein